jgi:hypothetical protein
MIYEFSDLTLDQDRHLLRLRSVSRLTEKSGNSAGEFLVRLMHYRVASHENHVIAAHGRVLPYAIAGHEVPLRDA